SQRAVAKRRTVQQQLALDDGHLKFSGILGLPMNGPTWSVDEPLLDYKTYPPVGVYALVSPWTVPFMTAAWKPAPCRALAHTARQEMWLLAPPTADQLFLPAADVAVPADGLRVAAGQVEMARVSRAGAARQVVLSVLHLSPRARQAVSSSVARRSSAVIPPPDALRPGAVARLDRPQR
ncbi:hypothetical protein ACU7M0_36415, partial [Burkholderia cenocepacia]